MQTYHEALFAQVCVLREDIQAVDTDDEDCVLADPDDKASCLLGRSYELLQELVERLQAADLVVRRAEVVLSAQQTGYRTIAQELLGVALKHYRVVVEKWRGE